MGVNVQINMENISAPVLQVGLEKTVKLHDKFSVSWLVTFIIIMTMTYCSEKAKQTYQFGGVVLGQLHLFFDLELTVSYLLYDTLLKLAVHEQGNVYVVEIFLIELEQCGC